MSKYYSLFLSSFFSASALLLSACSLIWQAKNVAPTTTNSVIPSIHIQLTPTIDTSTNTPPVKKTATLTVVPYAICPPTNGIPKMHEAETAKDGEKIVLDFLNQGGYPEKLWESMPALGSILDSSQVLIQDLNNDEVNEILLAANFNPPEDGDFFDSEGNLYLFHCVNNEYRIMKIHGDSPETITILAWENLMGSEAPEILIKRQWFYMMGGCDEVVELYSQSEKGWFASFESDYSGCYMKVELLNGDDGYKELIIDGYRGCSYMACGPWRDVKWTYRFLDEQVELKKYELLPSPYRIHYFEDAEIAIMNGELEKAISIYDKAARDGSLNDTLTQNEKDIQVTENKSLPEIMNIAHAYQTSFAYFRELVLFLYLKRDVDAENILKQMEIIYPVGEHGSELVDLSSYLIGKVNSGLSVGESCILTNEYLAQKYILGPNDFLYTHLLGWGDLSPTLTELLCPEIENR